ncbi:MAG: DUF21 domain-containing protein [Planctomycetaceae bacterium]|nr:DUF21 domain-containing protein [Planctomycetaceae bacterium]
MSALLHLVVSLILLVVGLRLSAFFSGSETGFYRASFLRLNLDAQGGDKTAQRLLWFSHHPSRFVATTLIGNNIANYITTFAIGHGTSQIPTSQGDWMEVAATLVFSPIIFIFGELVPKNLYYRSPLSLLRKNVRLFTGFYYAFWIVSLPLIGFTKLIERFSGAEQRTLELFLGRTRLVQVLSQGHQEGILSEVQSNLISGLMQIADRPVTSSMTPLDRILGLSEEATKEEVLQYARRYGLTHVLLHRKGKPKEWYAYLRVVDVLLDPEELNDVLRVMPEVDVKNTKLQALLMLRDEGTDYGLIVDQGRLLGTINQRGLTAQLYRPTQTGAKPLVTFS